MLTSDGEVVVLPAKYIDELKHLPPSIVSSLDAQYEVSTSSSVHVGVHCIDSSQNALGDYTNIVISSYLPSQTVRKRLTPSLSVDITTSDMEAA